MAFPGACDECCNVATRHGVDAGLVHACYADHDASACAEAFLCAGARVDGLMRDDGEFANDVTAPPPEEEHCVLNNPPIVASAYRNNGTLCVLLAHGADTERCKSSRRNTAIFAACLAGLPDNLALLLDYGADVNHEMFLGTKEEDTAEQACMAINSAAAQACLNGLVEIYRPKGTVLEVLTGGASLLDFYSKEYRDTTQCALTLLQHPGVRLFTPGRRLPTPLEQACISGWWPVAQKITQVMLERHGSARTVLEQLPRDYLTLPVGVLCVVQCTTHVSADFTLESLAKKTDRKQPPPRAGQVLHRALITASLRHDHLVEDILKLCLQHGIPGASLSPVLLRVGSVRLVHALIDAGADPNIVVDGRPALVLDARNEWDLQPTHPCHRHPNITLALLERGANPDAKNRAGYTALDYATRRNRRRHAEHLFRHGACMHSVSLARCEITRDVCTSKDSRYRVYDTECGYFYPEDEDVSYDYPVNTTTYYRNLSPPKENACTLAVRLGEAFSVHALARVLIATTADADRTVGRMHVICGIIVHVVQPVVLTRLQQARCVQLAFARTCPRRGDSEHVEHWAQRRRSEFVNTFLDGNDA